MVGKSHWSWMSLRLCVVRWRSPGTQADCAWIAVREDVFDSCQIPAHTHFCRADLVPGELGTGLWGRLVPKAICSDQCTSSASLLCSSTAGCTSCNLFLHLPPPSLPSIPRVTGTLFMNTFWPGTWNANGTLRTGNPGDLSRGGSSVSCLSWVTLSQQWLQNLPNLKASFNLMGRCLCI